ncbi:hypothetical protein Mal15_19270 [Stieleria maiorica]|uniref:Uncharacterized protein n=1 Tax=Stieleria maiorica TaxID=2795974 RepID=A0A5B9M9F3_9BACT|nr:ParB N-terminal domain-containing protein [Stieleria maiorica]QEF97881.1 hypothetical protein Mal15_19270 [Stieleria maiorica]
MSVKKKTRSKKTPKRKAANGKRSKATPKSTPKKANFTKRKTPAKPLQQSSDEADQKPTEHAELGPLPTIEHAIERYDQVTGVTEECGIMPLNSESQIQQLCESIKSTGQTVPIDITSDGKLLNGRHRLIACCALGIRPEFRIVDPQSPLQHVLADTNQREYNAATRAWIALEIEKLLRSRIGEPNGKPDAQSNDDGEEDVEVLAEIYVGDGKSIELAPGETVREAAIRLARSSRSAVRRLTTVLNKDRALAIQAVHGEITLKDAERQTGEASHVQCKPKIAERKLATGAIEYSYESRSAIVFPKRRHNGELRKLIVLSEPAKSRTMRVKTAKFARLKVIEFLMSSG